MNEKYEFSFDRGPLTKLIAGIASLVVLIFVAGILTGIVFSFRAPAAALVARAEQPLPKAPASVPAPVLSTPVTESLPPVSAPDVNEDDEPAVAPDEAVAENEAVVKPAPAAPPSEIASFAVQLGAFRQQDNAGVLTRRLAAKGYDAEIVKREDTRGRIWFLVRYGAFSNRAEATAVATELRSQDNLEALVRPINSM
jgi:cell division protein FtsN